MVSSHLTEETEKVVICKEKWGKDNGRRLKVEPATEKQEPEIQWGMNRQLPSKYPWPSCGWTEQTSSKPSFLAPASTVA